MKRIWYIVILVWTLAAPLAMVGAVWVTEASAEEAVCRSGTIIAFGRRRWCGYFDNDQKTSGRDVRVGGVPASVNTAQRFIKLINDDLAAGGQRRTAAQFIILTMIGRGPGHPQSVSGAQMTDWLDRVNSYASTSENGSQSFGPNGRIDWYVSQHMNCSSPNNINTFYQSPEDDVAPYLNSASNSDCEVPSVIESFIVFRNRSGVALYTIRRLCMNPMGNINSLSTAPTANYNLRPAIGVTANGTPVSGAAVEVGQTVAFTYTVTNTTSDPSPAATACAIYANVHAGYFPDPPTPTSGSSPPGYVPPPTTCPRSFTAGQATIATENIAISTPNQTICRSLFVSPATVSVASRGAEVCVRVANKPYARVYGGDIAAGGGLETAPNVCTNNANAAAVGWNKLSAGGFAGAGVQLAIFALSTITEMASSLGNGVSSAPTPTGLSFANNTVTPAQVAVGQFGGQFGSLPCIRDHFALRPSALRSIPASVALMDTGTYNDRGTFTIDGGALAPAERISVFVDGDVFITGNITYNDNWLSSDAPLFRLVVRGNIFISPAVTRLDGVYVAQKNIAGNAGEIHTCAIAASPLTLSGSVFTTCNNQLVFHGAVVANRVLLLRTRGSLYQSSAAEPSSSGSIAEVFEYNPALWMAQPVEGAGSEYNSITSLPPIL